MVNIKEIINLLNENDLLVSASETNNSFEYISYNSKDVKDSTLFICKGNNFKKEYLLDLLKTQKVNAYMSEENYTDLIPSIIVKDIRKSMSLISNLFYKDDLIKIGITGTKGKTTTNYFLHNILSSSLGYKQGLIATHYFYAGSSEGENHLTTPESVELHKYFNEMSKNNLKYVTMEVSSQAVLLNRTYKVKYDVGAFLNISPDHISNEEHKTFKEYLDCKISFLKQCDNIVIYKGTDEYDYILSKLKNKNIITFGFSPECDYVIRDITKKDNLSFVLTHDNVEENYEIPLPGRFNVINAVCSIVIAKHFNVKERDIKEGLMKTHVSGRMEEIDTPWCKVIVDYAHNLLSAKALYESIRKDYPDKQIKVVFGCPGDKGVNRRKDLGLLAGKYANHIYLTMEDPGYTDINKIFNDIIKYIKQYNNNYETIVDRETAIRKAISESSEEDIILLLGKGDENYQMLNGSYIPYKTDKVVVEEFIKENSFTKKRGQKQYSK